VGKVGNVVVGHMAVGDRAHFSVPEMITGKEILLVEIILSSIRRYGLSISPDFGQFQLQIQFDQLAPRSIELVNRHVPLVDEG